ncbi:hypothetical protein IQ289_31450 [Burkholderia sp. R-70006]|nr:hypothetical protein [Burkholderia sp. R-70006]
MVRIADYPQLRLIAWNRPDGAEIDAADALALYETNWRFIDLASMDDRERELIERLANEFGNGILNV